MDNQMTDLFPETTTEAVGFNVEDRLSAIVTEIASSARNMVEGAWAIGSGLNEAQELMDDDVAFGTWRREHIESIGLAKRTAQRMQAIARRYPTLAELPRGVNIGVVYLLSGDATPPAAQEEMLRRLDEDGELSVQDARVIASRASFRPAPEAPAEDEAPAPLPPAEGAVIDGDTGEVLRDAPVPAPAEESDDEASIWAARNVRFLRGHTATKRGRFLNRLLQELREGGMLDPTVGVHAGAAGIIEASD